MPDTHRLIPECRVSVDGKKLDLATDARLTRVIVDLDADLFGKCTLILHDPKLALINGKQFAAGVAVKVEIGFASKLSKIFEGEVVALEPQFRRDVPPSLHVICHESIHRLALSTMTRAFNDVDDKQIATKIAQEHGLTADAPAGSKEHVLQANVTDAAFLRKLAQKHSHTLRIEGKKLIIGPPRHGADVAISPGDGLTKLKVKVTANAQVEEVTVHGWDPKTRQEIVGKAKPQGVTGEGAKKYGKGRTLSVAGHESTPLDVASAEAMAKGRLRKIAEGFVVAQGQMIGDSRVIPGSVLQLDKISAGVDGGYRVDGARHEFSRHGYFINFKCTRVSKKSASAKAQQKQAKAQQQKLQEAAEADQAKREDKRTRARDRERQGAPKQKGPFGQKDTEFSAGASGEAQPDHAEAGVSGGLSAEHSEAGVSGAPSAEQADAGVSALSDSTAPAEASSEGSQESRPAGEPEKTPEPKSEEKTEEETHAPPSVIATLTGMHFEFDKAFALPGAIPTFRGIAAFLQKEPNRRVLVVGHTDKTGDEGYNLALSKERAEMVAAALRGDVDAWYAHYDHKDASKKWGAREDAWMLKTLGFLAKAPKDASEAEIKAALAGFQKKNTLKGDGDPTPTTRKALLQQYLDLRGVSSAAVEGATVLPCGERHPKKGASDKELRRVEVFLFDGEIKPSADDCKNAKHPGCTAYDAWIKEVTGDVPPEEMPPIPSGPQSTPDDEKYKETEPRIAKVTDKTVTVRTKDGKENEVPRREFEDGWGPEARAETKGANDKYAEAYREIALVSPPDPPATDLSIELQDAPVKHAITELRVRRWLLAYKDTILKAEKKWRVDRRAIAAAIAWEAMYNVQSGYGGGLARFSGPGKVHYKDGHVSEGVPLSKELEDRGTLPKQSEDAREMLLSSADGACDYIGAGMRAFVDIAAGSGYDLNQEENLPALLLAYNTWHLRDAVEHFKKKKAPAKLDYSPNAMANWYAKDANRLYIEAIVGKPDAPLTQGGKP